MRLQLPGVTLVSATSVEIEATIEALRISMREIDFAGVRLLTSKPPASVPAGIEIVEIPPMDFLGYSRFILGELYRHFTTPHCLVIQADGFVLNPSAWRREYLMYDYIGSPWPPAVWMSGVEEFLHFTHNRVGNGGFSLRSRRLMHQAATIDFDALRTPTRSEDVVLCHYFYEEFRRKGMSYAPLELAASFAAEIPAEAGGEPLDRVFGFHGKHQLEKARALVATPRPAPVPALATVGKAGRNEPCPCGSGRKYKHCHGRSD